jgi:hypothetical protein
VVLQFYHRCQHGHLHGDTPRETRGTAYWEVEEDDEILPHETIEGVNITITAVDGSSVYEATTDDVGVYRVWLPIGTDGNGSYEVTAEVEGFTPDKDIWEKQINTTNVSLDLLMFPINITFNGTTFIDQNGNGRMNRYEIPVQVEHIEIWDERNVSVHFITESDENGSFSVEVPPGTYNVFAWTEADGGYLVHLRPHTVKPSGGVLDVELAMSVGRRISGLMYYHNHTGFNDTVSEVNLTFNQQDGRGVLPVMLATGGSYFAVLPEGRYTINGSFEQEEWGVDMTYEAKEDVRMVLSDNPDADLNFSKVSEWLLEMTWDDTAVWIDENETFNFTVYAKNTGSENGTFDISVDVPPQWLWYTEVTNVSLNISERTNFWVQVNSTEQVLAVPQTITVLATPRDGDTPDSSLEVTINVNQHYGFQLLTKDDDRGFYQPEIDEHGNLSRRGTYFFTAKNLGNGEEVIKFTFGNIPGWEFEFPQKEANLKGYEEFAAVPIEVTFPDNAEMRPQVLRITGTAQNAPDNKVQTLDLELSFPDLEAKKSNVGGDEDGDVLKWPKNETPAFTTLAAVVAFALVAVMIDRRRRRW